MTFEDKLKTLESITEKMRKDITLEESIKCFEEGIELAKELEDKLNSFEKRVEILLENEDGDYLEEFK